MFRQAGLILVVAVCALVSSTPPTATSRAGRATPPPRSPPCISGARIVLQTVEMNTGDDRGAERDRAMADNVDWLLEERFPGEKIVLWAHNGHAGTAPQDGSKTKGMHLRDRHGDQMVVLGFAFYQGEVRAKRMCRWSCPRPTTGSSLSRRAQPPNRWNKVAWGGQDCRATRVPGVSGSTFHPGPWLSPSLLRALLLNLDGDIERLARAALVGSANGRGGWGVEAPGETHITRGWAGKVRRIEPDPA